ncbi:MAG: DUF3526 domain-containing protein [Flavobacteriales bacterium]|nr:MAG: DUF3526 domain-containing protein [Flavobacteriales bacterium]
MRLKHFSELRVAACFELKLMRRDPAVWLVLALLLAAIVQALVSGRAVVEARERAVAVMQDAEAKQRAELVTQIEAIESGRIAAPDRFYRDPRNAFAVSNRIGPTAALPPVPLALVAAGAGEAFPPAVRLRAGSKDSFLFTEEINNPAHLSAGTFDLVFVLVFVLPLCLLALTYNLVSGEREQGTFSLNAASPASLATVFGGKLLVRGGLPVGVTLVAVNAGIALATYSSHALPLVSLIWLSLLVVAYASFWLALAAFVNALRRDSALNALTLVGAWLVFVLLIPAFSTALSEATYPAPPRAEVILASRSAAIDAERDRAAEEARYRDEYGETAAKTAGKVDERTRMLQRIAVQTIATERADAVLARHDARVDEQARLAARLAFLSPAMLAEAAMIDLSGNGRARYRQFEAALDTFHREWRDFFIAERAARSLPLTRADYDRLPRFSVREKAPESLLPATAAVVFLLAALMLASYYVRSLGR